MQQSTEWSKCAHVPDRNGFFMLSFVHWLFCWIVEFVMKCTDYKGLAMISRIKLFVPFNVPRTGSVNGAYVKVS